MAERPVFVPTQDGRRLVEEVPVPFSWHSGMAASQKKKNVRALHESAAKRGLSPLLEISSKSEKEIGKKLSAFSLKIIVDSHETTLECAYQGSKVFENGGPFTDLYLCDSRQAKKDPRLKQSGNLLYFFFEEKKYPLTPKTAFYDWLYLRSLFPHREWLERLQQCAGFTDIEFNPERSLNCQARSCATFVSLQQRGILEEAVYSFESFKEILHQSAII